MSVSFTNTFSPPDISSHYRFGKWNEPHARRRDVKRIARRYNPGNSRHAQTLVEPNAFSLSVGLAQRARQFICSFMRGLRIRHLFDASSQSSQPPKTYLIGNPTLSEICVARLKRSVIRGFWIPDSVSLHPGYSALLIYFAFQTLQLIAQRSELIAVKSSQEAPLQAAQKVQEQFRAIITKTSELAKQGHTGAKMVLDSLQNGGAEQKGGQ